MSAPGAPDERPSGSGGRSLFDLLSAQRRFVYLAVTLLSIAGVWAGLRLPSAIYPELQFLRITVVAQGSALGARQTLFGITRPIEEAVALVPRVTRVRSRSIRGGSEVNITFAPKTDMAYALQQVQARVNQVRGVLPPELGIEIERLTPALFPILSYNVEGGDPPTLYDIARYQVRPLLSRVPGVGRVDVMASNLREISVIADPARLAAQGLSYDDLARVIRQSATVTAVGRLPEDYRQYLIVTANEASSANDIARIVVGRGFRVSDVATVIEGTDDPVRLVFGDGRPAALISITRQPGGNTVAIADSVAKIAASLERVLPPGVRLRPIYDQAALVRDAVKSVRDAMLIGAALAVLILLVFLRHARITAISASAIPLTMSITVFVMAMLGQTFNLMTLGAMAIAIGLVIDDAVVITENIVRHLRVTANRTVAIREAVQELIWPVTTSTITTVVVFLPLGLLTGVEGQFFHALSITLTIAVLVSLGLALTIIPLMCEAFIPASESESEPPPRSAVARVGHRIGQTVDTLTGRYEAALAIALRHARLAFIAVVVLMAGAVLAHRFVGTGFLPEMDEGAFIIDYWTPGGTALAETDRQIRIVEGILASTPEVAGTSRRTGAELGLFATEQNRGDIAVRMAPLSQRSRTIFAVIDEVRVKIERTVPRLRVDFIQILSDVINDLAGAARPVEIKLFGPNMVALETYARALTGKLASVQGLVDLYDGVSEPTAEITMSVNQAEARRLGLSPADVTAATSGALLGVAAGEIRVDDRSIPIRVRAPDSVRFDPLRLSVLPILSPVTGSASQLGALASFRRADARAELLRENQQQMIVITASISGRSLGAITGDIRRVIATNPAPRGVRLELAGQSANQSQAFNALILVLVLAALSVIAVMVIQFQSFIEPLVILLAAPLSFVGAMLLLLVTGTPLNVSSFMGLILLVGLIVKNGIILLDFTRRRMREDGIALEPAIREAGRVRLRPILMTTLCTLFGLLPLGLGLGAGSELQRPLALAVMGGLTISTPITLFLVPAIIVAIRGRNYTLTQTARP